MSRKSKIDPVEKVKIVERYLNGKIGIIQAGMELGGGVMGEYYKSLTRTVQRMHSPDLCPFTIDSSLSLFSNRPAGCFRIGWYIFQDPALIRNKDALLFPESQYP